MLVFNPVVGLSLYGAHAPGNLIGTHPALADRLEGLDRKQGHMTKALCQARNLEGDPTRLG